MNAHGALWRRLPLLCFLIAALVLLVGNGRHALWDRDEPRNATASRTMLETGDWVTPTFNGELRAHKPILVNWTQAAALRIIGREGFGWPEFAVRLPSSLAGAVTVAITARLALALGLSGFWAAFSALFVLVSPLFLVVHKAATTDGILIAATWWAIYQWILQHRSYCPWRHGYFAVALGLSILQKGPVGPLLLLLLGLSCLIAARGFKWPLTRESAWTPWLKRWSITAIILIIMVAPWVLAVDQATDGAFLREALGTHVVKRATSTSGMDGHDGPIWFYLPILLLMVLPLLPSTISGLRNLTQHIRERQGHPIFLVLGIWVLLTVLVFSAVGTKLPHYILPVLPALGILVAKGLSLAPDFPVNPDVRMGRIIYLGFSAIIGIVLFGLIAGYRIPEELRSLSWSLVPVLALLFTGCLAVVWTWSRLDRAVPILGISVVISLVVAQEYFMPNLEPLRASRMVTEAVKAQGRGLPLGAVGYREPSLVWYHGAQVEMFGRRRPDPALEFLYGGGRRLLIIERPVYDDWNRETTASLPQPIWSGKALNLQKELFSELLILDSQTTPTP